MKPTIEIDTRAFSSVLQQYAALNRRKTFPEIVNAKALDFGFRVIKETPKASAQEIRALESKEWWPKYIAKRIGRGVTLKNKGTKFQLQGKGYTREEGRRVSRQIIASRLRSVAFVKSGWLETIRRLYSVVRDRTFARGVGGARQVGAPKGSAVPARSGDNPTATMVNSAIGVDKVGVGPAERAMGQVRADMAVYVARKLEEAARRVAR